MSYVAKKEGRKSCIQLFIENNRVTTRRSDRVVFRFPDGDFLEFKDEDLPDVIVHDHGNSHVEEHSSEWIFNSQWKRRRMRMWPFGMNATFFMVGVVIAHVLHTALYAMNMPGVTR